ALHLDGENGLVSPSIDTDVDFIGLELTDTGDLSAEVTLEGITSDTCEDVNQAVVAQLGEKRLLVVHGVHIDHAWSCIGYFGLDHHLVRHNLGLTREGEAIAGSSHAPDDPVLPFGSFGEDRIRQGTPVTKGVNDVT